MDSLLQSLLQSLHLPPAEISSWAAVLTALLQPALGIVAMALLLPYLDRVREMNWRSHRPSVVGMHLAWALWLGWVAFHGLLVGDVDLYHLLGLLGAWLWLATSRPSWRHGPPQHTSTAPAPLDGLGAPSQAFSEPFSQPAAHGSSLHGKHH